MARYGSWGAVAEVFDERRMDFHSERAELRELLTEDEYDAARRTTLNAHFTNPAYVAPMWESLELLGFNGGRVLEPGSGMGTFIGMAPQSAVMTGVELDPITAAMSQMIYPHARIENMGFEDVQPGRGTFDAAIGNVPFGNISLPDATYNPQNFTMHNHFIVKSLELTKPGGVAAFITSSYTLDARNTAAREAMYERADLLGAVRLPNRAHRRAAGTDVMTDVLLFRVRAEGEQPRKDSWVHTHSFELEGETLRLNDYYRDNPTNVLGELHLTKGAHGRPELGARATDEADIANQLRDKLASIAHDAQAQGLTASTERAPEHDPEYTKPIDLSNSPSTRWAGHIFENDGEFYRVTMQSGIEDAEPIKVPKNGRDEMRALMHMRDEATRLVAMEAATTDNRKDIDDLRASLHRHWTEYLDAYGPINRMNVSEGKDREGNPTIRRRQPTVPRLFRDDPFSPIVFGLENYNEETGAAKPARILLTRQLTKRVYPTSADTINDALSISLNRYGAIDLDYIASLRDCSEDEVRVELEGLVFTDPETDDLVLAGEYLSGDVRQKLETAQEAARENPDQYTANVQALQDVLPEELKPEDIEPQIGAVWISAKTHEEFIHELLDINVRQFTLTTAPDGSWTMRTRGIDDLELATSTWGTSRMNAAQLMKAMLEQRQIQVHDTAPDGTTTLNPTETEAAQEKAAEMRERFKDWIWADVDRTDALVEEYNRRFNSIVLRDYSEAGKSLTFPGMAATWNPRPHQRTAVARIVNEPSVGLFHQVGAGKTAVMVMGAMEMKRLGIVNKPAIVVPNHMLEQFSREAMEIYPGARILAAGGSDLTKHKQRAFIGRIATGDWDIVIMTRGAWQKLDLKPENKTVYIKRELDHYREALKTAKDGGNERTVKEIENLIEKKKATLKKETDKPFEPGITFEDTGIDYAFIDEAHDYKNLATPSNIRSASITGSQRAFDMHTKVEYLRDTYGKACTFATGTPISNSMTEAYVMQRYLRPDLLEQAGIRSFDQWAATFGTTETRLEVSATGVGMSMKTRFARFQNVPELLRMMHVYADVKLSKDLNLDIPELRPDDKGTPGIANVAVERSVALGEYLNGEIVPRAERIHNREVAPSADNMLLVTTDARLGSLSLRLLGREDPEEDSGKIAQAARQIASEYHEHKDTQYSTDSGEKTPGALQIVFGDITASKRFPGYHIYDDLIARLVDDGVPREKIRVMQDAKNDAAKARLFSDCRNGKAAILIGSTQTMGTGTNVQRRAIALHHLDCPWRPADVEQREGRILRQGNENNQVGVFRYVTKSSQDAYMWQTVESKARFIGQILLGEINVRAVDDLNDATLSYGATKAVIADDPRFLRHAELEAELKRLRRLEKNYANEQARLKTRIPRTEFKITHLTDQQQRLTQLAAKSVDTRGDKFQLRIAHGPNNVIFDERAAAADALKALLKDRLEHVVPALTFNRTLGTLATVGGHSFDIEMPSQKEGNTSFDNPLFRVQLRGTDIAEAGLTMRRSSIKDLSHGFVQQLENRTANLANVASKIGEQIEGLRRDLETMHTAHGADFKHASLLRVTQKEFDDLEHQFLQERGSEDTRTVQEETLDVFPGEEGPDQEPEEGTGSPSGGDDGPTTPPQTPTANTMRHWNQSQQGREGGYGR